VVQTPSSHIADLCDTIALLTGLCFEGFTHLIESARTALVLPRINNKCSAETSRNEGPFLLLVEMKKVAICIGAKMPPGINGFIAIHDISGCQDTISNPQVADRNRSFSKNLHFGELGETALSCTG
jgi:hypothetical protein